MITEILIALPKHDIRNHNSRIHFCNSYNLGDKIILYNSQTFLDITSIKSKQYMIFIGKTIKYTEVGHLCSHLFSFFCTDSLSSVKTHSDERGHLEQVWNPTVLPLCSQRKACVPHWLLSTCISTPPGKRSPPSF